MRVYLFLLEKKLSKLNKEGGGLDGGGRGGGWEEENALVFVLN